MSAGVAYSSIEDLYWTLRDTLDRWLVDKRTRPALMADVGDVMLRLQASLQHLDIADDPRPASRRRQE